MVGAVHCTHRAHDVLLVSRVLDLQGPIAVDLVASALLSPLYGACEFFGLTFERL